MRERVADVMDVFPNYSEDELWKKKVSRFVKLERDAERVRRRRIADQAKAFALGGAQDPNKAIAGFLRGDFW